LIFVVYLNSLWVYDQTHFTWMSGETASGNNLNIIGTDPGILDISNIPGSGSYGKAFMDNQGLMNMFGVYTSSGYSNMLWKFGFGHECFGKSICKNPINEVCSGHGKCINWNQCSCDEGYSGPECQYSETVTCFGKDSTDPTVCSGHGTCIANHG